jgi:hypothetical protein
MPSITALTIADGATTPVNHTFAAASCDNGKATFFDKVGGVPAGYSRLDHEIRLAKSDKGAHAVTVGINVPIMATVNGVVTRVRNSSAQVRLNFAQDSTDQERKDLVAYVINALSNSTVKPTLYNIEPFFG